MRGRPKVCRELSQAQVDIAHGTYGFDGDHAVAIEKLRVHAQWANHRGFNHEAQRITDMADAIERLVYARRVLMGRAK